MKKLVTSFLLLCIGLGIVSAQNPSTKVLLPKRMYTDNYSIAFTYDELNRFTTIEQIEDGMVSKYDSIVYSPNNDAITIYTTFYVEDESGELQKEKSSETINYTRQDNKVIVTDDKNSDEPVKFIYEFTPSDRMSAVLVYEPASAQEPTFTKHFVYDANDNPLNAYDTTYPLEEVNNMRYDNMNGIFKHVNRRDCFLILYDAQSYMQPGFDVFMNNNLVSQDFYEKESIAPLVYEYNEYGYPVKVGSFEYIIEYYE